MTDVLLDTNVLCYATDPRDPRKRSAARDVLDRLALSDRAVITAQVLGEFARATTRPHRGWLTPAEARRWIADMLRRVRVVPWNPMVVLLPLDAMHRLGWSYWDAQIWAAARLEGVRLVLSEDFDSGASVGGVAFRNPFAEGFDLEAAGRSIIASERISAGPDRIAARARHPTREDLDDPATPLRGRQRRGSPDR